VVRTHGLISRHHEYADLSSDEEQGEGDEEEERQTSSSDDGGSKKEQPKRPAKPATSRWGL
jgi:hypothetical protein